MNDFLKPKNNLGDHDTKLYTFNTKTEYGSLAQNTRLKQIIDKYQDSIEFC